MADFTWGGVLEVFVAVVLAECVVEFLIRPAIERRKGGGAAHQPAPGGAWG